MDLSTKIPGCEELSSESDADGYITIDEADSDDELSEYIIIEEDDEEECIPSCSNASWATDILSTKQDLSQKYPIIWEGNLQLKNYIAGINIRIINGNLNFASSYLVYLTENSTINIKQRINISETFQTNLSAEVQNDSDLTILIILPVNTSNRNYTKLIYIRDYLLMHRRAGAAKSNVQESTEDITAFFVPKDEFLNFYTNNLDQYLYDSLSEEPYLIVPVFCT